VTTNKSVDALQKTPGSDAGGFLLPPHRPFGALLPSGEKDGDVGLSLSPWGEVERSEGEGRERSEQGKTPGLLPGFHQRLDSESLLGAAVDERFIDLDVLGLLTPEDGGDFPFTLDLEQGDEIDPDQEHLAGAAIGAFIG